MCTERESKKPAKKDFRGPAKSIYVNQKLVLAEREDMEGTFWHWTPKQNGLRSIRGPDLAESANKIFPHDAICFCVNHQLISFSIGYLSVTIITHSQLCFLTHVPRHIWNIWYFYGQHTGEYTYIIYIIPNKTFYYLEDLDGYHWYILHHAWPHSDLVRRLLPRCLVSWECRKGRQQKPKPKRQK